MPTLNQPARRISLDQIKIASPCDARWEDMEGDDIKRFCDDCKLHVVNISAMTEDAAQAFLAARVGEGRTCVRLFRRTDGTVLTQDCPTGLRLVRLKAARAVGRAAALLTVLVGGGMAFAGENNGGKMAFRTFAPFRWFAARIATPPVVPPAFMGKMVMGDMCVPAPTKAPVPPAPIVNATNAPTPD